MPGTVDLLPVRELRSVLVFTLLAVAAAGQTRWVVANDQIEATFAYSPQTKRFMFEGIRAPGLRDSWLPPSGFSFSPIRLTINGEPLNSSSQYELIAAETLPAERGGQRQRIVLQDVQRRYEFTVDLDIYPGHPVLRRSIQVKALTAPALITAADLTPWTFAAEDAQFTSYRINQWAVAPRQVNFEPLQTALDPDGSAVFVHSGSGNIHCSWLALRDQQDRGIFLGWEFNGRADVAVRHLADRDRLTFAGAIDDLSHPLEPGESFTVPASFLGLFHGDWDEAGFRTQQFAEAVLAVPSPDTRKFPYAVWDSWGYQKEIDEETLRRNARLAAQLGIELFVVDLGWAERIGDWQADPAKFPSGLRALSDYVHSLGMKFGLHFVPTEAEPQSRVLLDHPEWRSSRTYLYIGAESLCPSHAPARQWIIDQAVRLIEDNNVDWILQDGQTLVKECTRTDHTHHPADSNYSNAVDGIDRIVAEIQRRAPRAVWENCANGGNMMTFQMVRQYVTSITNDASGSLGARQGMFGATFPFPARYSDRYMPDSDLSPYVTRSFIFGGPWIFMNRLPDMTEDGFDLARREIQIFKRVRDVVRAGRIFHLTLRPAEGRIDAIQALDDQAGSSVAVVTRESSAADRFTLRPRGLNETATYRVTFASSPRVLTLSGLQIMNGLRIDFTTSYDAEVVSIDLVR